MSFHRVIVAFDGSERSADALALRLLEPAGALTLACVVPGQRWHVGPHVHRPDAPVPDELAAMFADARAAMVPAGIRVRKRAPVAASPARGLTELAEAECADLIVIGSSSHADDRRIRLGARLDACCKARRAPSPSLPPACESAVNSGTWASPTTPPPRRAALAVAYDVAARCGSAVTLYSAVDQLEPGAMAARMRRRRRPARYGIARLWPAAARARRQCLRGAHRGRDASGARHATPCR